MPPIRPTLPTGVDPADYRLISQAEVADMVAEEVDSIMANQSSSAVTLIKAHINQMQVALEASTKSIVDTAVNAALKAHIEVAYPPGPLHKHKDHHQGLIDSAEQWRKIKTEVLSWGLRGSIGFVIWIVGVALLEYVKREATK
jgi:hypothetical protein